MSIYRAIEWTCDRCGKKQQLSLDAYGGTEQPLGWAALYEVTPPLKASSESDRAPQQVCEACRKSYHEWLSRGRDRAAEAAEP
jgi:hypothetical protein